MGQGEATSRSIVRKIPNGLKMLVEYVVTMVKWEDEWIVFRDWLERDEQSGEIRLLEVSNGEMSNGIVTNGLLDMDWDNIVIILRQCQLIEDWVK